MASTREYALVGGFVLAFGGGLFLSFRPGSVLLALGVLVPAMVLFFWGLLTTPQSRNETP